MFLRPAIRDDERRMGCTSAKWGAPLIEEEDEEEEEEEEKDDLFEGELE